MIIQVQARKKGVTTIQNKIILSCEVFAVLVNLEVFWLVSCLCFFTLLEREIEREREEREDCLIVILGPTK